MKCHRNQSLFKQLDLITLQFFLIFKIFSCFFFEIYYRTKAVVCQNSLQVTVQCTAVKPMHEFIPVVEEVTMAKVTAVENSTGFVACSPRLVLSHKTYYTNQMKKKEGKMTQQIKTFFQPTNGCLCRTETRRGVHNHHSLFKQ
jgi:hypothetical protein